MFLFNLLKQSPVIPGTQNKTYQYINNIGKKTIKKMLSSKVEREEAKKSILKAVKKLNLSKNIIFSEETIKREGDTLFRLGLKDFVLKNYDTAIDKINEVIKIERNNLFYYWNQARLYSLQNNYTLAKKSYNSAIDLIKGSNFKEKNKLIDKLKKEKRKFSKKEHGKIILNVDF